MTLAPTLGPSAVLLPARRSRRPEAASLVTLAALLVALLVLLPLGFILWVTFQTGWRMAAELVFRPRVGELLANTLLLEVTTLPPSILVALALAWLTERSDLPGARLWAWLATAPLAVPAFVHSYAWVGLIPGIHGLGGAALVATLAYFPFLYLPIAAQLRRLDPAAEQVAASLGLGPWAVLFRVVLPQLRLAILGGALLVGLHLLAEYGLFVMIRFSTFTTAIVDQFQSAYDGPAANMLAGVLVLCCLGLIGLEASLRGSTRYARLGAGAPRPAERRRLGRFCLPALLLPALVAALSLGVPLWTLGHWLHAGGLAAWRLPALVAAAGQTLLYALAGGALTLVAALPMAWLAVRRPGRLQRLLEACHTYVGSLPGVVVALALVTVTVRLFLPLYQTVTTVLLAYMLLFLPRALVALRAGIAQVPVELEQAALALGRPPLVALCRVTLRLAAPGLAAAMALAALGITTELTATLLLAPNGTGTLATEFWAATAELDYAGAAPYALLMILASLPLTFLLHAQSRRMAGR